MYRSFYLALYIYIYLFIYTDSNDEMIFLTRQLDDPDANLMWGGEPILRAGAVVGSTTSACFGPTLGRAVAMVSFEKLNHVLLLRSYFYESPFVCGGMQNICIRYTWQGYVSCPDGTISSDYLLKTVRTRPASGISQATMKLTIPSTSVINISP